MKKINRKKLVLFLVAIFVLFPSIALADKIDSIEIRGIINPEDGSISILQTWEATPEDGTEFFIPMQELNDLEIVNYHVSDEEGPYVLMEPWDIDASLSVKARKYGINYTSDGIELCFGKTELKHKTYFVSWDYLNAVESYNVYDGFNIKFVNDSMDPAPDYVLLELEIPGVELTRENARIWSFGNDGTIRFENGKIYAEIENFSSDKHLTVMVRLEKGLVNPTMIRSGSFDDLANEAFVNSKYSYEDYSDGNEYAIEEEYSSTSDSPGLFGSVVGGAGFIAALVAILIAFCTLIVKLVGGNYNANIKNAGKVDKKNPEYHREIPFEKDLAANFFAYNGAENMVENILSATLLVWMYHGYIEFGETVETTSILKREKKKSTITILSKPEIENSYEEFLFESLVTAADGDNVVTEEEYKTYLKNDKDFIDDFVKKVKKNGQNHLKSNGYIEKMDKKLGKKWLYTDKGLKEAALIPAFERFLKDFTLIHERTPIEVFLWDEILIGATLFGKGKETLEKFEKFYPDYTFGNSNIYHTYYMMNNFTNHTYTSAIASSSESAGFGGGASMGGGGGSSGGGSGGGGR